MHNGNIAATDSEDNNFAGSNLLILVVAKNKQVATVEGWLHRSGEYNNNGTFASSNNHHSLPNHESRRNNHGEVQDLKMDSNNPKFPFELPGRLAV
jgi:hypothetical protein